jgi:hypothetical protein
MPKISRRNLKILLSSLVFLSILVPLIAVNLIEFQQRVLLMQCGESWCIRIYGNVKEEFNIGLSYFEKNDPFDYISVDSVAMLNRVGTSWTQAYAGVSLSDIFELTDCIPDNATLLRFEAVDGYKSFNLPIRIVTDNPDQIIICNSENGQILATKEQGGEGPLKSYVPLELIQNDAEVQQIYSDVGLDTVFNSAFSVKWLDAIYII